MKSNRLQIWYVKLRIEYSYTYENRYIAFKVCSLREITF